MSELPWGDNLLERKLESDLKDLLKTLVAFSNSVKPDHIATILIGEKDDGTIVGVTNPDSIQKTIRKECEKIYPPILWRSKVYESEGKFCVRVEIEYDGDTPHFGGTAWIRKGSETVIANEETFQRLIDLRSDLVRELAKWLGKQVTVTGDTSTIPPHEVGEMHTPIAGTRMTSIARMARHRSWETKEFAKLIFVNNFWVTFERMRDGKNEAISESLRKVSLSYDNEKQQLMVIVAH